jgi:hypothetical protein
MLTPLSNSHIVQFLLIACFCLFCGCSGPKLFPVNGNVTLEDGSPVVNATVVFTNSTTKTSASGTTSGDGSFQLTSLSPGDGAPPGSYRVTVHQPMPEDSSQSQGARLFPATYERPDTSGLSFEVKESTNNFPISLKQK